MKFVCPICKKEITRKDNFKRHLKNHKVDSLPFVCDRCGRSFLRRDALVRHLNRACKRTENKRERAKKYQSGHTVAVKKLRERSEKNKFLTTLSNQDTEVSIAETAFKKRIVVYRVENKRKNETDINSNFQRHENAIKQLLQYELKIHRSIKFAVNLICLYRKPYCNDTEGEDDDRVHSKEVFLRTSYHISTEGSDLDEILRKIGENLKQRGETYQMVGSGWSFHQLSYYLISILKYAPMRSGSFIATPKEIANKKATINIQNTDDFCFLYSIICHVYGIYQKAHPERESHYQTLMKNFKFKSNDFPMRICRINHFLSQNPGISINVFGVKKKIRRKGKRKIIFYEIIGPLFTSVKRENHHVNILMLEQGSRYHYIYIKNFSRLARSQFTKAKRQMFLCDSCFSPFMTEAKRKNHLKTGCLRQKIIIPPPNSFLQFKNFDREIQQPFFIVADSESLLLQRNEKVGDRTTAIQQHECFAFAYKIIPTETHAAPIDEERMLETKIFVGEDASFNFFSTLRDDCKRMYEKYYAEIKPLVMTTNDENEYKYAENCHICKQEFDFSSMKKGEKKVRDHCHHKGGYRGAAHSRCNLNYQVKKRIVIYFHNLGYDIAHFIRHMAKHEKDRIKVIPLSADNYISISLHIEVGKYPSGRPISFEMRFVDSLRLLGASLDKLSAGLSRDHLINTTKEWKNDENAVKLLSRKAAMCYDYIDSYEKLSEKELPPIEKFNSLLKGSQLTQIQYDEAKEIYRYFKCGSILDYYLVYLRTDCNLLADAILAFRDVVYSNFKLSMENYWTLPGLSFDCFLKSCKQKIELMHDPDMIYMINENIRGGINQVAHKHTIARNKFVDPNFDDKCEKPISLLYVGESAKILKLLILTFILFHRRKQFIWQELVRKIASKPI
jgi:hypothetical protein